jgi:hypothetical protein
MFFLEIIFYILTTLRGYLFIQDRDNQNDRVKQDWSPYVNRSD